MDQVLVEEERSTAQVMPVSRRSWPRPTAGYLSCRRAATLDSRQATSRFGLMERR